MKEFAYARASSVNEAVAAAAAPGAKFLGGGTNLVDLIRLEGETPELSSMSHTCRFTRSTRLPKAAFGSAPASATATSPLRRSSVSAIPPLLKRCSRAPPDSFGTPRRPAATSCSGRVVRTSRT